MSRLIVGGPVAESAECMNLVSELVIGTKLQYTIQENWVNVLFH